MATVFDVAKYIVDKCGEIDTWKLQKLVYYCQAWSMVWDEKPLFDSRIEAWANGPVNRELWDKFREYGYSDIPQDALSDESQKLSKKENDLLDSVWETYGEYSGFQLESLSHDESPWIEARQGLSSYEPSQNVISKETIRRYYSQQYSGLGVGE